MRHLAEVTLIMGSVYHTAVCLMAESSVSHVFVFAGDGDMFLWGSNKHGQLATPGAFLPSPSAVKPTLLGGEKVIHAWSGWTHIVAQTGEAT